MSKHRLYLSNTMSSKAPIGVIDSGIGGVTVWREIVALLPHESTVYYADSANCPYGTRSYDEIFAMTEICVKKLLDSGVKIIVIACNTITAASIKQLREQYPAMLFVGMEPAVKPAAALTKTGVVGILATRATLAGELYHNTLNRIEHPIEIIEMAGDGLVELIEDESENSPQCEALTRTYIEPMIESGADCVVLGCTHYPFLIPTIERISHGRLTIINPAPAVARRVKSLLESNDLLNTDCDNPHHVFLSSGTAKQAAMVERRAVRNE